MEYAERNRGLFIADAIRQVFGINSPIYVPWGKRLPYEQKEFGDIELLPDDAVSDLSEFGTPVLGTMMFESGSYKTYDRENGNIVMSEFADYALPYSCIADFGRSKNITKTHVLGGIGTVKELYGLGDWDISVKGIAINSRIGNGPTATEQIETLCRWAEICDTIGVQGSVFRGKGIYSAVIESITIHPLSGRWNAVPFELKLVSDEPIELYLK